MKERVRLVSKRFFQFLGSMIGFTLLFLVIEACWHGIQFHYGWRREFSNRDQFFVEVSCFLVAWVVVICLGRWVSWSFRRPFED